MEEEYSYTVDCFSAQSAQGLMATHFRGAVTGETPSQFVAFMTKKQAEGLYDDYKATAMLTHLKR